MPGQKPSPRPPRHRSPRQWRDWLALILFAAAFLFSASQIGGQIPAESPPPTPPQAKLPATQNVTVDRESPPDFTLLLDEFLPQPAETAHHVSLARLPDGKLSAAWLVSSEAAGPSLWFSARPSITLTARPEKDAPVRSTAWASPFRITHREQLAGDSFARINYIGPPQLIIEGGWLEVWTTASAFRPGDGHLVRLVSTEKGKIWQKAQPVRHTSLGGAGMVLGGPPLKTPEGELWLPLTQRLSGRHHLPHLSATGRIMNRQPLPPSTPPADHIHLTALGEDRILLTQTGERITRFLGQRHGHDLTWSDTEDPTPMENPSRLAVAVLALPSGGLLMAANTQGSSTLDLWWAASALAPWQHWKTVEQAADGQAHFSPPALLADRQGVIYLAYPWRQRDIRLMAFASPTPRENRP